MATSSDFEQLMAQLGPVVSQVVSSGIQEIRSELRVARAVSGTVASVDGTTCAVTMDDGGLVGSPTPGQIECIRMAGVGVGDRVRVHFFADASAEAHRVETS